MFFFTRRYSFGTILVPESSKKGELSPQFVFSRSFFVRFLYYSVIEGFSKSTTKSDHPIWKFFEKRKDAKKRKERYSKRVITYLYLLEKFVYLYLLFFEQVSNTCTYLLRKLYK